MTDTWQFASRAGSLTWTSPALPNGGQLYHTTLSPTLMMGFKRNGDIVPQDYIELQNVVAVFMTNPTSIQLDMKDGKSLLVVSDTEEDTRLWLDNLKLAIGHNSEYSNIRQTDNHGTQQNNASSSSTGGGYDKLSQLLEDDMRQHRAAVHTRSSSQQSANAVQQKSPDPLQPHPSSGAGNTSGQHSDQRYSNPLNGMSRPLPNNDLPPRAPVGNQNRPPNSFSVRPLADGDGVNPSPYEGSRLNNNNDNDVEPVPNRPVRPQRHGMQVDLPSSGPPRTSSIPNAANTTTTTTAPNAQTTVYASQGEKPVPGASSSLPLNAFHRPLPSDGMATAGGSHYQQNQHQPSSFFGGGGGRTFSATGASPTLNLHSGLGPSQSRPIDGNALGRSRQLLDPQARLAFDRLQSEGSLGRQNSIRSGSQPGRRKRMFVDLPASQHVNRSIAPNPSAMWKTWTAPDKTLYFFHEATQTLQQYVPQKQQIETVVFGLEELSEEDIAARPKVGENDTVVDINSNVVSNLHEYGVPTPGAPRDRSGINEVASSDVFRQEAVRSPRGQFSPTRRATVEALAAPRVSGQGYQGKRLHRVTLKPAEDDEGTSVLEHQVESLQGKDLVWDPATGKVASKDPKLSGVIGDATIFRQWEHVRRMLTQGRYFKKHSVNVQLESYRFVFLTSDNSYVVSVPTSDVMMNVNEDPLKFGSVTDTIQYYSPDAKAFPVNEIVAVSLGTDEEFTARRRGLTPKNTFVIVTKKHALILECQTAEEAKLFCDSWNFFLYYSSPINVKSQRTPAIAAPVTHGTRAGVAF